MDYSVHLLVHLSLYLGKENSYLGKVKFEETPMYRLILVAASALSILAVAGSASPAAARHYRHSSVAPSSGPYDRYCLQGRIWGYPGNCQFATYSQCMATASGTDAYCDINPTYAFARQRRNQSGW